VKDANFSIQFYNNQTTTPTIIMVKFVTSMAEFEALKAEDKLLVVDFTASWCVPKPSSSR
jgi:thiol:disulfide interchange protein